MAKLVGATRGTLRRCLDDLASRGGIEMRYRKLRVLDPNVLAAFNASSRTCGGIGLDGCLCD